MPTTLTPAAQAEALLHLLKSTVDASSARISSGPLIHRQAPAGLLLVDREGRPARGVEVALRLRRHEFQFGANLFMLGGFETAEQNRMFEDRFVSLFNAAVIPYFWDTLEPKEGQPRFAEDSPRLRRRPAVDVAIDFCRRHALAIKGHPLVYYQFQPAWVPRDEEGYYRKLFRRIDEIAERHGHEVGMWDVVNEALDRPWSAYMPSDYVFRSLEHAARRLPSSARLFLNEATMRAFDDFHGPQSPYYLHARELLSRGARVDGLGFQYHYFFYNASGLTTAISDLAGKAESLLHAGRMLELLDCYGTLNLPLHISEITIPCYAELGENAAEFQADLVEQLYRLWFSHPAVAAIYWWNMPDGCAHGQEGQLNAGLLNADLSPKASYTRLLRLIHREWTTALETVSDGRVDFRGFFGAYEVVTRFRGVERTHHVTLARQGAREFQLMVEAS